MIILTSMAIGFTSGLLRQTMAIVLAALLIVLAYGAAFILSGSVSPLSFAGAVLGFNAGLFALLMTLLVQAARVTA